MDLVRTFNSELSSLYECQPPISKAKMTSVTKTAIKAIKFYKHVVQSVEKFIQKCKPVYKVPGLYVVDSIVRQSRHQYGNKDVFAPRFAKNINVTFQNLFKCPPEEKSKIVRVLNLWQKNNVFTSDVIQPLLDMANPNHPVHQQTTPNEMTPAAVTNKKGESAPSAWPIWNQDTAQLDPANTLKTVSQLIQQSQSSHSGGHPILDNNALNQLQQITNLLTQAQSKAPDEQNAVKFNKKLLDFDYGDEDDEEEEKKDDQSTPQSDPTSLAVSMAQNLLNNPELLRQLQQMQQTIQQTEALKNEMSVQEQLHKQRLRQQEEEFVQQIQGSTTQMAVDAQQQAYDPTNYPQMIAPALSVTSAMQPFVNVSPVQPQMAHLNDPFPTQDQDERQVVSTDNDRDRSRSPRRRDRTRSRSRSPSRNRRRLRRSRSRSKSPRRRRSRSNSRSRVRHRRDRDRDRDRERDRDRRSRSREREREKEREKERERKKRGLPPIKKDNLSVCSTTLWLGHVSKLVSEEDLSDTFGEFGDIVAIDMIPPRGCAFVCMNRRQDAYRALQKLKNLKLQGKTITIAWAPGKGVKGKDFKDYWDADLGVSYIPYEKLPNGVNLDALEEGGTVDEETVPERLKEQEKDKKKDNGTKDVLDTQDMVFDDTPSTGHVEQITTDQQANAIPIMQPLVANQFGMAVPGLVPTQAMAMMQLPIGVPPPAPMVGMMVPPVSQSLLNQSMSLVAPVPMPVQQPYTIPQTTTNAPTTSGGRIDKRDDDATPTQESQENSPDGVTTSNTDTKTLVSPASLVSASTTLMSGIVTDASPALQTSTSGTLNMEMNTDFTQMTQNFQPPASFNPSLPPPSFRLQSNFAGGTECNSTDKDPVCMTNSNNNWNNNKAGDGAGDIDMRDNPLAVKEDGDPFENPNRIPLGMIKSMHEMGGNQRPPRSMMDVSPQSMMRNERSLSERLHGHAGYNAQPGLLPQPQPMIPPNRMMGMNNGERMPMHDRMQQPSNMMDAAGNRDHMGLVPRLPFRAGAESRPNMFQNSEIADSTLTGMRFGGPRMPNGPGLMGPAPQFPRFPGMGNMNRSQMMPQDGFQPRGMARGGMMFPNHRPPFMGPRMDRMGMEMDRPFPMDHPRLNLGNPDFRDDRFHSEGDRFAEKWKRQGRMDDNYRDYPPMNNHDWRRDDTNEYDRGYSRDRYGRERRDRDKEKGRRSDERDWSRPGGGAGRDYRRPNEERTRGDERERNRKSRWSDGVRKSEIGDESPQNGEEPEVQEVEPVTSTTTDNNNVTVDKLLDEPMNIESCEGDDEITIIEPATT